MDQLLNAGRQFLESQNNNQGQGQNNNQYQGQGDNQQQQFGVTGGAQYNRPDGDNSQHGNAGAPGSGGFNLSSILSHANNHDNQNSGGNDLFGQAVSFLQNQHKQGNLNGDIDEQQAMQDHQAVNSDQSAHSNQIGNAAALGAIKNLISGNNNNSSGGSSGGGDLQSKLIGMAMAQAGQLFDQKDQAGQVAGGDKQQAMNSAAESVMKLVIKNGGLSMLTGGANSGGLGQLAGLLL